MLNSTGLFCGLPLPQSASRLGMAEVQAILQRLRNDPYADVESLITEFQLRPTLLDSILPKSLELLASTYAKDPQTRILHTIYTFSRVRGYKLILQGLPTNVQLLEFLPKQLRRVAPDDWQSQYTLLLWLSTAILVPFDMSAINAKLKIDLYSDAFFFLDKSGIQRDAASILMARLLTRSTSDQETLLNCFVKEHLAYPFERPVDGSSRLKFIGVFQTLAHAMDRVSCVPQSILSIIGEAERRAAEEIEAPFYESSLTARLWLKILGRTALRLPHRFGEFAVSECMTLFDHESSQVRMSAAKYVARVSRRLGPEAVQEVCDSIIASLENEDVRHASTNYWNGALIALAEIMRGADAVDITDALHERLVQGVLERKALHFIQARLRSNIGTNVRDAACYVCWSLFRSKARVPQRLRLTLYSSLISSACLDNEVNIRRAASAALQEGLGRYGSSAGDFDASEMFNIMEKINLHSVTLLSSCYRTIVPEFCSQYSFFPANYVLHGINSGVTDVRRTAAEAIPAMPGSFVSSLAELLLRSNPSGDGNEEDVNLHGKWLALGTICTGSTSYVPSEFMLESCRKLVQLDLVGSSDLAAEAMLHLIAICPNQIRQFFETLISEDPHVIAAAKLLMGKLDFDFLDREIIPLATKRMYHSRLFVACLVEISKIHGWRTNLLLPALTEASNLPDPQSRALAVSALDYSTAQSSSCIAMGLKDYSEDERGDVGAWVREAAIARVSELGLPEDSTLSTSILASLWLMASECRQKTRLLAGQSLFRLGQIQGELSVENSMDYFLKLLEQCPLEQRSVVCLGLASSTGAVRASVATVHGSFEGLIAFLKKADSVWVLSGILGLSRASTSRAWDVVRTLKRLTVSGFRYTTQHANQVLAIAYNTTLNRRYSEAILLDAIDILQVLAFRGEAKARERLSVLLRTSVHGTIRQRCADAMFELGVEDEVLETTDWTNRQALQCVQKLSF